jgi:hypothetical protein
MIKGQPRSALPWLHAGANANRVAVQRSRGQRAGRPPLTHADKAEPGVNVHGPRNRTSLFFKCASPRAAQRMAATGVQSRASRRLFQSNDRSTTLTRNQQRRAVRTVVKIRRVTEFVNPLAKAFFQFFLRPEACRTRPPTRLFPRVTHRATARSFSTRDNYLVRCQRAHHRNAISCRPDRHSESRPCGDLGALRS